MRLKSAVPMLLLLLLCACGAEKTTAQTPVTFRTSLVNAGGCSFTTSLRADYGDHVRDFTLDCQTDAGSAALTVREPQEAQGITARVSGQEAQVSFDSTVLAVEDFESRDISPMAAPYLLKTAWAEGYITTSSKDGDWEVIEYTLGYGTDELTVTTAFEGNVPVYGEISDGKNTLISCEITNFALKGDAGNDPAISEGTANTPEETANPQEEQTDKKEEQTDENAQTDMGGDPS